MKKILTPNIKMKKEHIFVLISGLFLIGVLTVKVLFFPSSHDFCAKWHNEIVAYKDGKPFLEQEVCDKYK